MNAPKFDLYRRFNCSAAKLRDAIQVDADLRREAEAELAAVAVIDPDRCVMSKEYADLLREALE